MEHKITIYGTSTCASCALAKEYLKSKNFEYEFKNVGEDAKARSKITTNASCTTNAITPVCS